MKPSHRTENKILNHSGTSRRGRGATANPASRFDRITYVPDLDTAESEEDEKPSPITQFLKDTSRSIIATNDSPDIGFNASINPYRGCEHGCVYCYARPTHEYLGFSAGLDFETKIMVKEDAPELLRRELSSPHWKPQVLGISGVTDAYQPIERKLQITRRCLQVLAEFRNPVVIVTKNFLVTRDSDVLVELARCQGAVVFISVTTLQETLSRRMEPRASNPSRRLAALRALSAAGIPTGVLVAPIIPGLNDHEIPAILSAAAKAGARNAGYTLLRLPYGLTDLFEQWLAQHYPEKKEKVLNRIRSMRGGRLNDPRFFTRLKGEGKMAELLVSLFRAGCLKAGIDNRRITLSADSFRKPGPAQPSLFEL
ncbi:MAG: PA0069 family radical SAM protein [Acidobacteria bacterium]|nr:PA0069 family radical SAM protein [Acidobacteriota bacterium]MBI3658129.1 PA0069 family radical SAM protein [Acidobacteriota bacterium]